MSRIPVAGSAFSPVEYDLVKQYVDDVLEGVCYSEVLMGEKLISILRGMASTMDLLPSAAPSIGSVDCAERLSRSWVRTGQAIQRSIDHYDESCR